MIHRILSMLRIGRISIVDDSGPIRRVQIDEGNFPGGRRVIDKVAHIQEFGFSGVPPIGADALLAAPGGDRSQTIVAATNHQPSRPRGLQPGDSCLYDVRGRRVALTANGIEVDAAGGVVTIRNASKVRCECDVETTGDIVSRADGQRVSLNALHDAYNMHHHTGVAAGSAVTGTTDKPL